MRQARWCDDAMSPRRLAPLRHRSASSVSLLLKSARPPFAPPRPVAPQPPAIPPRPGRQTKPHSSKTRNATPDPAAGL
ncbi:MAG: hypothetical protein OXU61_07175 [Gammaproteobacteria bacterium]|nr:hypothetical protein [Gammaproteobacteria bacterium]